MKKKALKRGVREAVLEALAEDRRNQEELAEERFRRESKLLAQVYENQRRRVSRWLP